MVDLPRGTNTFLFTDIEGSAALWERDRSAKRVAVDRQLALLRPAADDHGGVHFIVIGDAIQAAFPTAPARGRRFGSPGAASPSHGSLERDRCAAGAEAIDVGEAAPDARGDYLAAPLNRLSRLLAAGHGGQILFTQPAQQLVWDSLPADTSRSDLGEHQLRDLFRPPAGPNRAHYRAPGVPRAFP
jgi:class 3 adenylate cyclase